MMTIATLYKDEHITTTLATERKRKGMMSEGRRGTEKKKKKTQRSSRKGGGRGADVSAHVRFIIERGKAKITESTGEELLRTGRGSVMSET